MASVDEQALFSQHSHTSWKNLFNAFLCFVVPLPSVAFSHWMFSQCDVGSPAISSDDQSSSWYHSYIGPMVSIPSMFQSAPTPTDALCSITMHQPLFTLNALFFLNVCVLFWAINVFQRSTWLIDPYWTILPVLIAHFYAAHPLSSGDSTRVFVAMCVLYVWSARLTHSYFRRERWKFGVREDWRFEDKRMDMPSHFWWFSFFYAFVSQMPMLVGITLPFHTINFAQHASTPWDSIDLIITYAALAGIAVAYFADTQLSNFMAANRRRMQRGKPKVQLLNYGLWYYSRHPNYFGEQLFWWAIAAYAWRLGVWWPTVGTIINSIVLATVTVMTEKKMTDNPARADIYKQYQKTTSVLIPWFKFSK